MSQNTIASVPRPFDPSEHEHRFACDWGTANMKLSYQLSKKGAPPIPSDIEEVYQQGNRNHVPQRMGFIHSQGKYRFLWGFDFDDAYNMPSDSAPYFFQDVKMALYESPVQDDIRRQIEDELELLRADVPTDSRGEVQSSVDWLVGKHLYKAVHPAAKAFLRKRYGGIMTQEDLEAIPERWTFLVPESASHEENARFQEIIRYAEFPPNTMLVSETEAAAAWRLWEVSQKVNGAFLSLNVRTTNSAFDEMS